MIEYVCGFLFSTKDGVTAERVLLIKKQRPAWQLGRYNGIGGKIEPGESPKDAMVREFREEAGIETSGWEAVAILTAGSGDWRVIFYSNWCDDAVFDSCTARTDEPLVHVIPDHLHWSPVLPNLRVLIPLALDKSGIVKPVLLTHNVPQASQ